MVGLVVVSHSRKLADGVVELASEMGGGEVDIVAAGGTDLPDDPLGTDAMKVMAAIRAAQDGDGVVVLMDLGSAVLSAEMAVDMIDPDEGRILLCEAPLIEGAVAAASAARAGMGLEEVAAEARNGLAGKVAHLASPQETPAAPPVEPQGKKGWVSARIRIDNPLGLHARPAARFVRTASSFAADVRVTNLSTGAGPASARSLNALATLGVRRGHDVLVEVSGREAGPALGALRELAGDNFGDALEAVKGQPSPTEGGVAPEGALAGVAASPGLGIGPARRAVRVSVPVREEVRGGPQDEWDELEEALAAARHALRADRDEVARRAGDDEASIFDAHELMLEDASLLDGARRAIFEGGSSAPRAWATAVAAAVAAFDALDDAYLRQRGADVADVGNRVLARLAGIDGPILRIEGAGVLIAEDLAPADTVALDLDDVVAMATSAGGPDSHAAILSRAFRIPAVVGTGPELMDIPEGTAVAVDGSAGLVYVEPAAHTLEQLRGEKGG
jgi:multiphosphoryl transfer protein